jgi:hypothetical protein
MSDRNASSRPHPRPDHGLGAPAFPHRSEISGLTHARRRRPDDKRLRCADVARNRAVRYARRHRKARAFLPLISIGILVGLLLERRPALLAVRTGIQPDPARYKASRPKAAGDGAHPDGAAIDESGDGAPQPRYRPPEDFLAKDVAQVIAFLIRNRGRIDTQAVRTKWNILDRFSLPLAVHLREIEATGAWNDLEREIRTARPPALAAPYMPHSVRHRKLLALLPEWENRGEVLLSGSEEHNPAPAPDITLDVPNTDPPTP